MSFDQSEPPPPYDFKDSSYNNQPLPPRRVQRPSYSQLPVPQPAPRTRLPVFNLSLYTFLRAQQPIGIYHAGLTNLCLALSADTPPLNHITSHNLRSPSLSLHVSGSPNSPVIARAQYRPFSSGMDLTIAPVTGALRSTVVNVDVVSYFSFAWGFSMHIRGARERFEWRHSHCEVVRALNGGGRGLKLVRLATGQVVMAYANSSGPIKLGKFRWVSQESWGQEADIIIVMSAIAVVERIRRNRAHK